MVDVATSLLGLTDDEFVEAIAHDSSVSDWLFGEMKAVLLDSETDEFYVSKHGDNLLLIAARIVASDGLDLAHLVNRGFLTLPRIIVMCSLYAQSNEHVLEWWLQRVCSCAPRIVDQIPMLHDVFYHALLTMHHQVASLHIPCIIEATRIQTQLCDMSKTIHALLASSDVFLSILTPPHAAAGDLSHSFDGQTLLHAILVCYETDLPILNKLSRNDKLVPVTRRHMLSSLGIWLEKTFLSKLTRQPMQAAQRIEAFFGVLNSLLHNADAAEPASLVSDLCKLLQFKTKCRRAFDDGAIDDAQRDYLALLLSELPERARPATPAVPIDDTNPNVVVGNTAQDDRAAILQSIGVQVKDIFPDLGDGFLELVTVACEYSSDKVIVALLEDVLPPAVASLDRTLTKSDPRYIAITASALTSVPASTTPPTSKADPTQIWVGKKKLPDMYKPESVRADPEYLAKQLQLAQTYDQEPAWPEPVHMDEYNDDYNDELEEYEPFGVRDDEPTDYEDIIARNKVVRAREAEDAFWESMRNPNHSQTERGDVDVEEGDDGREGETKRRAATPPRGLVPTKGRGDGHAKKQQQPGSTANTERQVDRGAPRSKQGSPSTEEDPKKQQITRARKEQNKSVVANHRRKDKALKKQGGGGGGLY
ncbi:hypothetical protein H310_01088 [Aphanomyces invadans]|uniref:CUE domain-containing protein n=1 Tax=Aphanomyces invadans TaxID=157072 RepID=A0A024UQT1_9STRA|nr:hypothetical protein H310_01088 [Aphanomyces invadans]ETW08525.1 hypothetical protein H310_01088 [Aphanomyces invadans]|eukprot:XP_008862330.1 hypothetical protein H310_01088 [Aphanomyces invadans]